MELIVGSKYRLGRKIGSGSFGDIYLGECGRGAVGGGEKDGWEGAREGQRLEAVGRSKMLFERIPLWCVHWLTPRSGPANGVGAA